MTDGRTDEDLEDRILSLLPYGTAADREHLLGTLGRVGGARALDVLVPIVDGTTRSTATLRATAIQSVGRHATAADHLTLYALALKDRDLFVQTLALAMLRRWDRTGAAAPDVAAWVKRRLHGRTARKITDYTEFPMAVGYFAGIDDLAPLASLLERYDDQVAGVDRAVLEYMWPRQQRQRWATGTEGDRPDLTGLGEFGHSYRFYVLAHAVQAGVEVLNPPREITAEQEAQWAAEHEAGWEAELAQLLTKLERRRDKAQH